MTYAAENGSRNMAKPRLDRAKPSLDSTRLFCLFMGSLFEFGQQVSDQRQCVQPLPPLWHSHATALELSCQKPVVKGIAVVCNQHRYCARLGALADKLH